MIRHCVLVKFKPSVEDHERVSIYAALEHLVSRLPGADSFSSGPNCSPEEGMDKGFNEGFIMTFRDAICRDAYLVDAEHQRIGARLVNAAAGGKDGILVFDFNL